MDTLNLDASQPPTPETEAERQRRLAWAADGIVQGRGELDAGLYVDAAESHAWIARISTDNELPPPPTRYRAPD